MALALIASATAQSASEYDLKAAFLFNFTRFVDWPSSPDGGAFCIAVVGSDPFLGKLENAVSGRAAANRSIVIKHMKNGQLTAPCEVIFFSGTDLAKIRATLASIHTPTLTVGEVPSFAHSGGIVEFSVEAHKLKLTINLDAAQRAHLQISSKLLQLASVIRDSD
ncbi:MAG TPA: YfiR family protein [Bryobacteraceae bacterium]|jgi:hypothetical protein|nr:YfiR family protein [Bryobacteraceae bacterium]